MSKGIIISGKVLEKGKLYLGNTLIGEDCKIDYLKAKRLPVTYNFDHINPIGTVINVDTASGDDECIIATVRIEEIPDKRLTLYQKLINWIYFKLGLGLKHDNRSISTKITQLLDSRLCEMGIGFTDTKISGNEIKECKIHEVSISPKINKDGFKKD